jgi:hypothetical protein
VSYDDWKLATPPEDEWLGEPDALADEELDIDVCQNCGRYFAWTQDRARVARKHHMEGSQRCIRCIKNETWCEPTE